MPTFHDDCSTTDNWTNVAGEFTSDGEIISVSSWQSTGELSAIAQAYVHMFDDPWTLKDNFDFTINIDTDPRFSIADATVVYIEFGDLATNKWAFWIGLGFGFGQVLTNGVHELRYVLVFDSSSTCHIDIYVDGSLFISSSNFYSSRNKVIKDFRIQITHTWGKWTSG